MKKLFALMAVICLTACGTQKPAETPAPADSLEVETVDTLVVDSLAVDSLAVDTVTVAE